MVPLDTGGAGAEEQSGPTTPRTTWGSRGSGPSSGRLARSRSLPKSPWNLNRKVDVTPIPRPQAVETVDCGAGHTLLTR